jgi:RNA polymerase sigma-70 factor, ECF subfamily
MDQGDLHNECFLRLFAANQEAIHLFVRKLVPSRQDADEVMQEIAVVLWKKFSPACEGDGFRRWAFWVARYEVLAWRRTKARDRHVFSEDLLVLLADETIESEDRHTAQRDALSACLEKLSEPQRKLLLAAYAARGGMKRIAEQSGRSHQGFYRWLYRIRALLLKCVQKTLQEEMA